MLGLVEIVTGLSEQRSRNGKGPTRTCRDAPLNFPQGLGQGQRVDALSESAVE